jgi:hypothetical protein
LSRHQSQIAPGPVALPRFANGRAGFCSRRTLAHRGRAIAPQLRGLAIRPPSCQARPAQQSFRVAGPSSSMVAVGDEDWPFNRYCRRQKFSAAVPGSRDASGCDPWHNNARVISRRHRWKELPIARVYLISKCTANRSGRATFSADDSPLWRPSLSCGATTAAVHDNSTPIIAMLSLATCGRAAARLTLECDLYCCSLFPTMGKALTSYQAALLSPLALLVRKSTTYCG